jgi:hypothetical protein
MTSYSFSKQDVQGYPSCWKRRYHCFWDTGGAMWVDIMPCGRTANSDLYIRNLKPRRSVSRKFEIKNVAGILSTTKHEHARALKYRKQPQNSHGLFFHTHHTAQTLLHQISTSLVPSKMPFMVNVCLSQVMRVDRLGALRRANPSLGGILPSVVCLSEIVKLR